MNEFLKDGIIMAMTRLPAFPLITVDPSFTIWSPADRLYDTETVLWCNTEKKLLGKISVNGKAYRFMGLGQEEIIPQADVKVKPYVTTYTFENDEIILECNFWSAGAMDDLYLISAPAGYFDYKVTNKTDAKLDIKLTFTMDKGLCFDKVPQDIIEYECKKTAGLVTKGMGVKEQKLLSTTGDLVGAEWGVYYLTAENVEYLEGTGLVSVHEAELDAKAEVNFCDILSSDDIESIEYLGQRLKGLWTEKWADIFEVITYYIENKECLFNKISAWNEKILNDGAKYGEDYQFILCAALRQVMAAHKLVRNNKGKILFLSKECKSNGCINTVDVSYPSSPLFFCYNPILAEGLMNGIIEFANLPVWACDYAPHDLGQYPVADGQVYALKKAYDNWETRHNIYNMEDGTDVYHYSGQMPVEECGNMVVMAYVYALTSGNTDFLKENYATLKRWADYLVKCGNDLEYQLCTDDFAGRLAQNINLAIKSVMGQASFAKILEMLSEDGSFYMAEAKKNAEDILARGTYEGRLALSFEKLDSWSMKYNMAWDHILGFDLFGDARKMEIEYYKQVENKYGLPLDCRKDYTKSDWIIWSSTLDDSGEATKEYSFRMRKVLEETEGRVPFSDWYSTIDAKDVNFAHRTVQGGMWMPVLRDKLLNK